jgi:hypothetical protein
LFSVGIDGVDAVVCSELNRRRPIAHAAGDEVIMSIAGHVSRAMLSRYSHVRMEAKRHALDEIAARQRAADEKRQQEVERQQPVVVGSPSAMVH